MLKYRVKYQRMLDQERKALRQKLDKDVVRAEKTEEELEKENDLELEATIKRVEKDRRR